MAEMQTVMHDIVQAVIKATTAAVRAMTVVVDLAESSSVRECNEQGTKSIQTPIEAAHI